MSRLIKSQLPTDTVYADFAGIKHHDTPSLVTVNVQDLYTQVKGFTHNLPYSVSVPDFSANDITVGADGVYEIGFSISMEVAGVKATIVVEAFQLDLVYMTPITGITKANPGVVTAAGHGLANGDKVHIHSVTGMTEINDQLYKVANKADNTFELTNQEDVDVNTGGYGAYTGPSGYAGLAEEAGTEIYGDFPNGSILPAASAMAFFQGQVGHEIELFIKNMSNTNNPTVYSASLAIRRVG